MTPVAEIPTLSEGMLEFAIRRADKLLPSQSSLGPPTVTSTSFGGDTPLVCVMTDQISAKAIRIGVAVFVLSAVVLILLRSKDCFAVDGGFRCLDVYRRQNLFFHGNHHLLYPVNVLVWTRLLSALGFQPGGPLEFFSTVEVMNCLAGAGCLAILSWLTFLITFSARLAFGTAAGFGLTGAFIAHATNANEPMLAIFWSFLGIVFAVVSVKRKSVWPILLSGFLFSLAMATYRSAVLFAPAALVLIIQDRLVESGRKYVDRDLLGRIGSFTAAWFIGCVSIYAWAYSHMGDRQLAEMVRHFFVQEGARAYLGFGIGRLLNVPLGLVRNVFPIVPDFSGIRNLFADQKVSAVLLFSVAAVVTAIIVLCCRQVLKNWNQLHLNQRIGFLASSVGLVFTMIPVLIWNPYYDKLWIQPFSCLSLITAIALTIMARQGGYTLVLSKAVPPLVLIGVLLNLGRVIPSHTREPYEFKEAERMAALVGKQDFVVGGWDTVSTMYGALLAIDGNFLSLPSEAMLSGSNLWRPLRESISRTTAAGGKVYFLGLLDMPEPAWNSFLGTRCGVSYSEIDDYRAVAHLRARFRSRSGDVLLWQLGSDRER